MQEMLSDQIWQTLKCKGTPTFGPMKSARVRNSPMVASSVRRLGSKRETTSQKLLRPTMSHFQQTCGTGPVHQLNNNATKEAKMIFNLYKKVRKII